MYTCSLTEHISRYLDDSFDDTSKFAMNPMTGDRPLLVKTDLTNPKEGLLTNEEWSLPAEAHWGNLSLYPSEGKRTLSVIIAYLSVNVPGYPSKDA